MSEGRPVRGQVEICGCFPTGRHYPGIADRLSKSRRMADVRGLAKTLPPEMDWATGAFAVIDFETTGFDPSEGDRVLEMGIVTFDDGIQSGSHNWLINPTIPVPEAAQAVHGISDEMLADKPRFEEVWKDIRPHLEGRLPVAYNAPFDKKFLLAELERMGEDLYDEKAPPAAQSAVEWADPLVWVRELYPDQKAKLGAICEHLGISLEGAHRAANDAEATGKVLLTMADRMPGSYAELIRVQTRYGAQQNVDMAIWRGRRF
ncbi:MAG: exonuclease domain-containing protein [Sandaracinaceae bacterium]